MSHVRLQSQDVPSSASSVRLAPFELCSGLDHLVFHGLLSIYQAFQMLSQSFLERGFRA